MSLLNILKSLLKIQKKLDKSILPSRGLFYKDDFEIWIRKADMEDIIEYELGYRKDDIGSILFKLKRIVEKNTIFPNGYNFMDIKSVDIVFIFIEIVKFTNNKPFPVKFINPLSGNLENIEFSEDTFNYCDHSTILKNYDKDQKQIVVDGYKYAVPTIGIESSITNYLISKSENPKGLDYEKLSFDFIYFLGDRRELGIDEIDNLIQIFNFEISDSEKSKIKKIIKKFSKLGKYSLKRDNLTIDLTHNIDLEKVWR